MANIATFAKLLEITESALEITSVCLDKNRTKLDVCSAIFNGIFLLGQGGQMIYQKGNALPIHKCYAAGAVGALDVARVASNIVALKEKMGAKWTKAHYIAAFTQLGGIVCFRYSDMAHAIKPCLDDPLFKSKCEDHIQYSEFGAIVVTAANTLIKVHITWPKAKEALRKWQFIREQKKTENRLKKIFVNAKKTGAPALGESTSSTSQASQAIMTVSPRSNSVNESTSSTSQISPTHGAVSVSPEEMIKREEEQTQKEMIDIIQYRNDLSKLTIIPKILAFDFPYLCSLTGKPVRFVVIPNIPEDHRVGPLALIYYEKQALIDFLREHPGTFPPKWPQDLLPLPLSTNSFQIDCSRQEDIDTMLNERIDECYQYLEAEGAINIDIEDRK